MAAPGRLERPDFARHGAREQATTGRVRLEGNRKQALETGRTRLLVTGVVFAMAFSVLGLRLIDLAVIKGAPEASIAARTTAPDDGPETPRADIVDRNGVLLATTLPVDSIYARPRQIAEPQRAAARLATVFEDAHPAEFAAKLGSNAKFVWIRRAITPRQKQRVNALGIPGIYFATEERRVYPQRELASHVVGYTSIDGNGLAGLELAFDDMLAAGDKPLKLSLDVRVQHILSEELQAAMETFEGIGAAGVVLDVHSGEVIALASLPSFDPMDTLKPSDSAMFNRATLGIYEMGSVFKIFSAAMALDSGAVTLEDKFDVSKPIRVARFTINDYKPKDRALTVPEIFMYSSNIGTVHMTMEAGTPVLQEYFGRLGLLDAAKLELPEIGAPKLPSIWREINTMTIAYGHGLAVSPIQVASAVATIVNGGLVRPATLIRREPGGIDVARQVFRTETSRQMRWLMRLVVQHGTGRKAAAPGYVVGGKTGTADKQVAGSYARDARIASFVGAFPMTAPRYVVLAMVDEPKGTKETFGYATGGWVAAPVVRNVIERSAPLLGVAPRAEDVVPETPGLLIEAALKD